MPIQKFKFGQEITSSKLNEIVTFANNLETFLTNAQYWNNNVDAKITGFQNQLTAIVTQINNVLSTAENFQSLLAVFVDLKAKYETLIADNSQILIENLFSPANMSIDANGLITINGVNTGVIIRGAAGAAGSPGAAGTNGTNGINGKTILTGNYVPTGNDGTNGDIFIHTTTFNIYLKANGSWSLLTNLKGPTGSTGPSGAISLIDFRYRTNITDTPYAVPNASTRYIEFKNYLSTNTNEEKEAIAWKRLQIRSDGWYPVINTAANGDVLLSWSNSEPDTINPINIRGPQGPKGDPTNFIIKGRKDTTGDLPAYTATTGVAGEAWFVGAAGSSNPIYLWDTGTDTWINIGTLQGATGPAPILTFGNTVTGNSGSSASLATTNPSAGTYNLTFTIPRGDPGARGNRVFNVQANADLPSTNPWVVGNITTTLIVGDTFIVTETGLIQQVLSTNPSFTMGTVFTLPVTSELIYRAKAIETISKGDVVQFVGIQGEHKLIAKASQTQRTQNGYTVLSVNADPDLIMGVANETVNTNSFVDVYDFGQIASVDGVLNYIAGLAGGDKLWFDAAGNTPGRLTKVEPTGTTQPRVLVAAYLEGPQHVLQVSLGESKFIADIPGLQEALDGKAATVHTHSIANVTNLQTTLDGKAATSHTHAVSDVTNLQTALDGKVNLKTTLYNGSPVLVNISPNQSYTTLTMASNVTAGDRLLIRWGTNSDVRFWSEVFLIQSSGSDYYAVLEKRLDNLAGGDVVALLSVQLGTNTTTGAYTGTSLTFRNGMLETPSGTQTAQTMYVQGIYKVVI